MFKRSLHQGDITKLGIFSTEPAPNSQLQTYTHATKSIGLLSGKLSAYAIKYTDPFWRYQWNMVSVIRIIGIYNHIVSIYNINTAHKFP